MMTEVYTTMESIIPTDIPLFVSDVDENGRTALFYTAFLDLGQVAIYLLSHGTDIFSMDLMG
jgi:hypothetical protein